jgi:hypothetical protein
MKAARLLPIFILISIGLALTEKLDAATLLQSGRSIGFGESVSDQITSENGDQWTFTGQAGDAVTIEMTGISLGDTFLVLLGPSGEQLASDDDDGPGLDSRISEFILPTSGRHTITARGYGGELGTYSLLLEKADIGSGDGAPSSTNIRELSYGDVVNGRVSSPEGDRWPFVGETGDRIAIEMNGVTLGDSVLELLEADGVYLSSDDDSGPGMDAMIAGFVLPRSGPYTIAARGYGGETGSYRLALFLDERSDVDGASGSLTIGETVEDGITHQAGDRWTFQAETGDVVTIAMTGISLADAYLELIGPDGHSLAYDDDGGPDLDALISGFILPESGEYTIAARGYGEETGTYSLSLNPGSASIESEGFLTYGNMVENTINNSNGDEWKFSGEPDDVVSIVMMGITLDDTYIELYAPDGGRLAYDDDGGTELNSLISGVVLPDSGTYTVAARGYGGNIGSYTLQLGQGVERTVDNNENPLSYGSSVNGRITDEDGEEWTFLGEAGDLVAVKLNGITLDDPYLILFRPDGNIEMSDDDSGPGLNALIDGHVLPASGQYTILARSFGGRTGTYTLSLDGSPGGSPNALGVPQIATIELPACSTEATYFVLSMDGTDLPDHHYYKVTFEASGVGSVIQHLMPLTGADFEGPIVGTALLDIAGETIDLSGMGTTQEISAAIEQALDRQGLDGMPAFSLTWYETRTQTPLEFVILAAHPDAGGVEGTIEWQQSLEDELSEHRIFITCQ